MSTLSTEQVTLDLTNCSFCTSYHANQKEAEEHGCTKGVPPQQFQIGDQVWAKFALGQGMEVVGERTLKGEIVKIQAPNEVYGPAKIGALGRGWGYMNRPDGSLRLDAATFDHEWIVTVKALEKPLPEEGFIIDQSRFRESQLRKVEAEKEGSQV